ncbi:ribosome silencing factor [Pullulanibacillus sp. KACC 23026]|uniref:ribosome silencing factor n=1 Tax=Pullulanibacillus sp. KACC 23026 TaxID=3028315 RepID=UPI0023AFF122|nr:ribosome silencing factor [Pullulanibacillus sp. KACC 23026]WEG14206.1 ribosome silencing factor [Pullulanibacillus sp. KACC 23026]
MNSEALAVHMAEVADQKNAQDIAVLNMQGISAMADYFIICQGNSERQVEAIARDLKEQASKEGVEVKRMEGADKARWILIDLGDVIVHVFHREERAYYQLEKLWGDAPRVEVPGVTNLHV